VENVSLILTLKSKRGERGTGNGEEKIENSGRGKRKEERGKRGEKIPYSPSAKRESPKAMP
jgi:hypothetical protein